MNPTAARALGRMNTDERAKSLATLSENSRWLAEHADQTVRPGDLPLTAAPVDADEAAGASDQQQ